MIPQEETVARLKEACKPFDLKFRVNNCQSHIFTAFLPVMARVEVPILFDRTEVKQLSVDALKCLAQSQINHHMLELIDCANDVIKKTRGDQK